MPRYSTTGTPTPCSTTTTRRWPTTRVSCRGRWTALPDGLSRLRRGSRSSPESRWPASQTTAPTPGRRSCWSASASSGQLRPPRPSRRRGRRGRRLRPRHRSRGGAAGHPPQLQLLAL